MGKNKANLKQNNKKPFVWKEYEGDAQGNHRLKHKL